MIDVSKLNHPDLAYELTRLRTENKLDEALKLADEYNRLGTLNKVN